MNQKSARKYLIVNCVFPFLVVAHNVGVENICEKCRGHLRDGAQLLEVNSD